MRNFFPASAPLTPSVSFRATWLSLRLLTTGAIPPISTLRVARSIKNSPRKRGRPRLVQNSMVKKSVATIRSQWRVRSSFHVVFRLRSGAGSSPCRSKIAAIVFRAIACPRLDKASSIRR